MRLNLSAVLVCVCLVLPAPGLNAEEELNSAFGKRARPARTQGRIRQERAYGGYPYQPTAGGYGYKPPTTTRGYIYTRPTTTTTTTTTTPEPAIESELDIDSQYITPAPPQPVYPEKEFESSPAVIDDSPDEWDIRDSVPGSPGENYPVYGFIPKTGFKCETRIPGYYADPETRCQVFHRCSDCMANVRLQMDSFLCPNGTQFNQEILSCDWWQNVHCDTANVNRFYSLNEELNTLGADGEYQKFSGMRQAPSLLEKIVAPRVIPKEERQPLAPQYRSNHRHSDGDGAGSHDLDSQKTQAPTLSPSQVEIVFNEFRKPKGTAKPLISSGNQAIDSALNNPDYFNPDSNEPPKVAATPASSDSQSDDDYFNNDAIETRTSIVEEEADKLDNDPLNPPSKATSVPKVPNTVTVTPVKPKAAKEIEFGDRKLQPLIPFQRLLPDTDKAEGFIVNRRPENLLENDADFSDPSIDDTPASAEQTTSRISGTTQPGDDYLPPKKDYLPPTTTTAAPEYLPPVTEASPQYLPPSTESSPQYLPPATEASPAYLPPKDNYLPPKNDYLPPKDDYLPPKNDYLPPQQQLEQDSYAPIPDSHYRQPSSGYGAPAPSYGESPSSEGGYSSGNAGYETQFAGYPIIQPAPLVFSNFMTTQFQAPPTEPISSFEVVRSPLLSYNHITSESNPTNFFTSPSAGYFSAQPPSYPYF